MKMYQELEAEEKILEDSFLPWRVFTSYLVIAQVNGEGIAEGCQQEREPERGKAKESLGLATTNPMAELT